MNQIDYTTKIKEYESNFKKFMGIDTFPQYTLYTKEVSLWVADAQGYDSAASTHYDIQSNSHSLTVSTNLTLCEYLMFHEFVHMLDSELYVKNDKIRYLGISGFTEYHASQIELLAMLGVQSINDEPSFSMDTIIHTFSGNKSVKQYISEKQQHAIELFSRADFPSSIETLKSSFGVLYNYWGLRSICEMYATDYIENIENQSFLNYIPTNVFVLLNRLMRGWLNDSAIDASIPLYANTLVTLAKQYKLA